jgi:hypothetical protein
MVSLDKKNFFCKFVRKGDVEKIAGGLILISDRKKWL